MRTFLILLLIIFMQKSFGQITVQFDGLKGDTVYVWRYPLANINDIHKDTIVLLDNKLRYQVADVPTAYAIIPNEVVYKKKDGSFYIAQTKFIELFSLPHEKIHVDATIDTYYVEYHSEGNETSENLSMLRKEFKDDAINAVKIELAMDSLKLIGAKNDEINKLFKERGNYFSKILEIKRQYIVNNPHLNLSAYLISRFSLESFMKYYPELKPAVRDGIFKAVLNNMYTNYTNFQKANNADATLVSGSPAPLFTLQDVNNKQVSLSELKGKLIIIDFWGTWCDPCIQELPELKQLYSKYKTKLEFVSIACNQNEDEWRKVINKHNLSWHQLINTKDHDISILYGVKAYPAKFILNEKLEIVDKFVGKDERFFTVIENLLK